MKGAILEDHKNEIIRLTTKSKSISPKHKRIIEELEKVSQIRRRAFL
jgi:hypothetical protein